MQIKIILVSVHNCLIYINISDSIKWSITKECNKFHKIVANPVSLAHKKVIK
jgi:hypothetical protein